MSATPAATTLTPRPIARSPRPLFALPPADHRRVPRERLLRQLLGARDVRVVLITAPAGYGKTTLLQSWAQADARPFRWLPAGPAQWAAVPDAAPTRDHSPWVLVADGRGHPRAEAAALDLTAIAEALPRGCLLAVATRDPAAVSVGRLRAQHELLELGTHDLALTQAEAYAALEAWGVPALDPAAAAVVVAAEGWPAAASLGAQAVLDAGDPARAATRFRNGDRFMADYVRRELLRPLSPAQRRFLTQTSVFETLVAADCAEVLEAPDADVLLADLEQSALPIARVDRAGGSLRCHPLLRSVLLDELRRGDPALEVQLRRRASRLHERREELGAAMADAEAAGDGERACGLLWRASLGDAWNGRRGRLERSLTRLRRRDGEGRPALACAGAMDDLARLAASAAAHRLRQLGPATPMSPTLQAGRAVILAATASDDVLAMRDQAAEAMGLAGDGDLICALCRLVDGAGSALAGDGGRATKALRDGARRAVAGAPGLAAWCEAEEALVALSAMAEEPAVWLSERARSRIAAAALERQPSMVVVLAVSALARARRGRFAEARADADAASLLLAADGDVPAWIGAQADLALGRALLLLADGAAARARLAAARYAAERLIGAPALRAWIATASADLDRAALAGLAGGEQLTIAELRTLRFLPSHLSFDEIGGRCALTRNTIKSQAHAVYRKLGVSSRSGAVERAVAAGLLDSTAIPPTRE